MAEKIQAGTVARLVLLCLMLINVVLTVAGKNPLPVSSDGLYIFFSQLATAAAALCGWWKNNSITQKAIKADRALSLMRAGGDVRFFLPANEEEFMDDEDVGAMD